MSLPEALFRMKRFSFLYKKAAWTTLRQKQVLHTFKSWSREFPGGPVVRTCAFTAMA